MRGGSLPYVWQKLHRPVKKEFAFSCVLAIIQLAVTVLSATESGSHMHAVENFWVEECITENLISMSLFWKKLFCPETK